MTNYESSDRGWTSISGYEGLYKISRCGEVLSIERVETCRGDIRRRKERQLKIHPDQDGYPKVILCKEGKTKTFFVHRLVATTFISNPLGLPQVNHKDGNKWNNYFENLEWCDQSHNMLHAYQNKLVDVRKLQGENHWKSFFVQINILSQLLT